MLSEITTVELQGANFLAPTSFSFFNPTVNNKVRTVKAVLLYGRNGTGKSTIAKGFRKIGGEDIPGFKRALVYDKAGKMITLSEDEKKHIFIFDEDYVNKNVRLQEDHLDTIVMLGEAADLTEKIIVAEEKRDKAKEEFEIQDVFYKEYLDYNNPKAPNYYLYKIENTLRGDDSWAGRDKLIKGNRQNTQVREDTYKQFVNLTPSKSKSELLVEYNEKLQELENAKTGTDTIDEVVPTLSGVYSDYNDAELKKLLGKKIEKPELTDREKYLLKLVEGVNTAELSKRIDLFKNEDTDICPYCLQNITPEYKAQIVKSIEKMLSKEVENHQKELQKRVYDEININLTPYEKLYDYKKCIELISTINDMIICNNKHILSKMTNPYDSIVIEKTTIAALVIELNNALKELEKSRKEHNTAVVKTEPIKEELTRINNDLAHYDVVYLAEQYDIQSVAFAEAKNKNSALKKAWIDASKEVEKLEAQRGNVQLALDSINACMKYILFSPDRLSIDYDDGVYKLMSHGKSVKPCDVSVGERNIIGLSYFFTSIMENQDEKDVYDQEYLLVIDDPVSSFDAENRIGILSFLKYKMGAFLEGNEKTKALVMTHDLMTFYDLHKILEEIMNACKSKGYDNPPIFHCFELADQSINIFKYKHRQEYTEMIQRIYKYAKGEAAEDELVIGNIMRQILEAFSTFQYKKDIEHVSTDSQILDLLVEKEYVSYFKNLMYRLVLHGGSHKEEQVKAMQDFNFFSMISDVEKKRTARDILCFIYILNPRHLLVHLDDCEDVEDTLTCWCQDIKNNAALL